MFNGHGQYLHTMYAHQAIGPGPPVVITTSPSPAPTATIETAGQHGTATISATIETGGQQGTTPSMARDAPSAAYKMDDADPEINRLMGKYDSNHDGHFSVSEVKAIIRDLHWTRQHASLLKAAATVLLVVILFLLVTQSLLVWFIVEGTKEMKVKTGQVVDHNGEPLAMRNADFGVSGNGILTAASNSASSRRASLPMEIIGKLLDDDHLGPGAATALGVRNAYQQRRLASTMPLKYFKELQWLELESPSGSQIVLKVTGVSRVPSKAAKCGSLLFLDTQAGIITLDDSDMSFKDQTGDLFERAGFQTQIVAPTNLDNELQLFLNGTQRRAFKETEQVDAVAFFNLIDDAVWTCESVPKPEPPTTFSASGKLYESCMKEDKNKCVYRGSSGNASFPQYGLIEDNSMLLSVSDLQMFNNATDYFRVTNPRYHPGVALIDHFHTEFVTGVRTKRSWQVHGNKTIAHCMQDNLAEDQKSPQALPDDYIFHYMEAIDGMRRFRISYQIEYQGEKIAFANGQSWFHIDYFDDNATFLPRVIIDTEGSLTRFDMVKNEADMAHYEDLGLPSFSEQEWSNCQSLTKLASDQAVWKNVTTEIKRDPNSPLAAEWNTTGWDFSQGYPPFALGPDSVSEDMLLYYLESELPADEEQDYRDWADMAMALTSSGFVSAPRSSDFESSRRSLEDHQMHLSQRFKRVYDPVPRKNFQRDKVEAARKSFTEKLEEEVAAALAASQAASQAASLEAAVGNRRRLSLAFQELEQRNLSGYKTMVAGLDELEDGNLLYLPRSLLNVPRSRADQDSRRLRRRAGKARTRPSKEQADGSPPMCVIMGGGKFCHSLGRLGNDWQSKLELSWSKYSGELVFKRPGLYESPSKQCKIVTSGAIEVAFYDLIKLKGEVTGEQEALGPSGDLYCTEADRVQGHGISGKLQLYVDVSFGLGDVVRFLPYPVNDEVNRIVERAQIHLGELVYSVVDWEENSGSRRVYSNNVHQIATTLNFPIKGFESFLRLQAKVNVLLFDEPIGDVNSGEKYRDDSHAKMDMDVEFQVYTFWKDLCFWCSSRGSWEDRIKLSEVVDIPSYSITSEGVSDSWGVCRQPCPHEKGRGTCNGDENSPCNTNMDGSLPTTSPTNCALACDQGGSCPGFATEVNTNYVGGDLSGGYFAGDPVYCRETCLARSDCGGFVHQPVTNQPGYCWLKSRETFTTPCPVERYDGLTSHRRLLCFTDNGWYCPDYNVWGTSNYIGDDIPDGHFAGSIQDCRDRCDDRRSDCFGFVHTHIGASVPTCWLKGVINPWRVDTRYEKSNNPYIGYHVFGRPWGDPGSPRCTARIAGNLLNGCVEPKPCSTQCGYMSECSGYVFKQDWQTHGGRDAGNLWPGNEPVANLAEVGRGGVAFGSSSWGPYCTSSGAGEGGGVTGIHCWNNINDGVFGNSNSWIPDNSLQCPFFQASQSSCLNLLPSVPGDAGGWRLVRHLPPGSSWHPATDQLQGTVTYGTPNDGANAWSVPFGDFDEFLFASGDKSNWLITTKAAAIGTNYANEDRDIIKSSINSAPSKARWYNRRGAAEDPWISLTDHSTAIANGQLLYGAASFSGQAQTARIAAQGGMNVFVRKASAADKAFVGVRFAGPATITEIEVSRDRLNQYADRSVFSQEVQVTRAETPNHFTPDAEWVTAATIERTSPLKTVFAVAASGITGIRLVQTGSGCTDELVVTGRFDRSIYTDTAPGRETGACRARCDNLPDCGGFTLEDWGKTCILKSVTAFNNPGYWQGNVMNYRKAQCVDGGLTCDGYDVQEDTNFGGGDMYHYSLAETSAYDCSFECNKLQNCAGFIHIPGPKPTCYLKKEAAFQGTPSPYTGAHAYIRRCPHTCLV